MSFSSIQYEVDGPIAVVTLNESDKLNALTKNMLTELRASLAQVVADRQIRALVITGAGRSFCSGANLGGTGGSQEESAGKSAGQLTEEFMENFCDPVVLGLRELPIPIICALNGPAAGAGVGLALAADIVIAARSAYFALPFIPRLGLIPDVGLSWHLPRLLGRARATALTLLGSRLTAERAVEWGMIWACVDDQALKAEAMSLARTLCTLPAHGALETRLAYAASDSNTLTEQLRYEKLRQGDLANRDTLSEGIVAFLQKRDPVFAGR